jgi:hypothetical protein
MKEVTLKPIQRAFLEEGAARVQFSRQDEIMWENYGSACVVEHRAGLSSDGRITVWNRENWASLRERSGYDRPGNVIMRNATGVRAGTA